MKAKEKDRKPKCQSVRQMPMGRKCKQGTWRHAEHGNRRLNVRGMSVSGFIFLGFKITADSDFSHEIKKCLLLGRKVMTNLDSILKQRHYFADKGPYRQSYGFSSSQVWM